MKSLGSDTIGFGQCYEVYRQQVGMLFPKLGTRDRKGPAQS